VDTEYGTVDQMGADVMADAQLIVAGRGLHVLRGKWK
jgi:hypothetical protein